MDFSTRNRLHFIRQLQQEHWDLLVIGGGITGCGIALDAASRGLKVALLEKDDFASGTSSKSTKLIHGGLRYLKQLEFGLVKEVGSERAVVHALAPHLVVPEKMLLPLYEKRGLGYWLTSIGLKIYDLLAGVLPEDQRKMLTRSQTLKAEPLLEKEAVKGGALYAEYRTDDARLTIEIAKSAFRNGACLLNYLEVVKFTTKNEMLAGAIVHDHWSHDHFEIHATAIVNAAGPWVDELRKADHSLQGKRLHLSKGVHIVVAREKLPVTQAIYFDVEDGRMIFAIPRGRITYIGTTDTSYHDSKDEVYCSREDAEYLIRAVNHTFPQVKLTVDDIESSWAGLRPLIHEDGKTAGDLSRKDEIFISASGLISIAGGKLTGYRKMAERVVNLVVKKHFSERTLNPCCTAKISLTSDGPADFREVQKLRGELRIKLSLFAFDPHISAYLIECFGKQSDVILKKYISLRSGNDEHLSLIRAQLHYCIDHEMVTMPSDFFVRRTGMIFFDIHRVRMYSNDIIEEMAAIFGWSLERIKNEQEKMNKLLAKASIKTS